MKRVQMMAAVAVAVFVSALIGGDLVRVRAQQLGYRALAELPDLAPPPAGFEVNLITDRATGYAFSLKDRLDPCGFSIFSDEAGLICAGTPIK